MFPFLEGPELTTERIEKKKSQHPAGFESTLQLLSWLFTLWVMNDICAKQIFFAVEQETFPSEMTSVAHSRQPLTFFTSLRPYLVAKQSYQLIYLCSQHHLLYSYYLNVLKQILFIVISIEKQLSHSEVWSATSRWLVLWFKAGYHFLYCLPSDW